MMDEGVSERHQWRDLISITKEQWLTILEDRDVVTEKDVQLLELLYSCDGCEATASFLARLLNMPHHAPLNGQVGQLGKRIVERLGISAPRRRYEEGFNWWHVPFLGETRKKGFYWILRPELQETMREIDAVSSLLETKIPEEIDYDGREAFYEGASKQIYVNAYERSKDARNRCIEFYGVRCVICGFDFEKIYGEVGRNIIHVHHLKPLSDIGETYQVDPVNDLCPVCPNCHVIIHKRNPPYSTDEVLKMIRNIEIE